MYEIHIQNQAFMLSTEELSDLEQQISQIHRKEALHQQEQETLIQRNWISFQRTTAKKLPWPRNVLCGHILPAEDGFRFLEAAPEDQQNILNGLLWALSSLPEHHRLAIEYLYRDRMTQKECADKLNYSVSYINHAKNKGMSQLRGPLRYGAILRGFAEFSQSFPPLEGVSELRTQIRNKTLSSEGYAEYRFRYIPIHSLGLSLETITVLLQQDIRYAPDLISFTDRSDWRTLPGFTPEIQTDIENALDFVAGRKI